MAHYKNNIPVLFDIYDEAEHIHEDRTVFDGCIDMGGLPDSYLGVNVTCNGQHFHEIYENRTPGSLEFRIDYKHGWLYLNPTIYNGQKITLDYYSRGIELTPASRIYTFDANGCVDLKTTLQTYIDEINEGCKFTEANVPSSVDAFENIKSGESFSTMFGKIARWFTELKAHLKGSKWRHKSEHVDCKDNKTVQVKIDELEQSDEALGGRIDAETEERKKSDEDLQSSIAKEANARANADTALGGRIDDEIKHRAINDTRIETKIDDEIAERKSADQALEGKINTKIFDIEEKLEGKAAKGVVTTATIDQITEPGIYGAGQEVNVEYFDAILNSTNNDPIAILFVSNNSNNQVVQIALLDASRDCYILVTRSKMPSSGWSRWERLDSDVLNLLNNKAEKGNITEERFDQAPPTDGIYVCTGFVISELQDFNPPYSIEPVIVFVSGDRELILCQEDGDSTRRLLFERGWRADKSKWGKLYAIPLMMKLTRYLNRVFIRLILHR